MAKVISGRAQFKKVKPEDLYKIYMSSAKHSAATGGKAVVAAKVGGKFSAFGGLLRGKILYLDKGKKIVQAWRAKSWKKSEADSILVLTFKKIKGGAQVDYVHEGVPDHDYEGVKKGWAQYYWRPWRKYLAKK